MSTWSFRPALFVIAFLAGAFALYLFEWKSASLPTGLPQAEKLYPISFSEIEPEDIWITGYDIYAASLSKVDSKREYILLLLTKKNDSAIPISPGRRSRLILKGLSDRGRDITFTIYSPQQNDNWQQSFSLLLDAGGEPFKKRRLALTNNLVLTSESYRVK